MSTVIHAAGRALVPAADFLSPYDFFRDLTNPALAFLPRALLIAVVAALVCGSVGVHVVLRGMAFIGDAVLQAVTVRRGLLGRARTPHFRAVEEALSLVGMRDLAKRPIGELSGGQRQRVLVARALAIRPAVLLLDEPFTGLDMPTQEMLMDLFRSLADGGRALLMTTHDLIGARAGCDRLYLLRRTIVASGRPEELADADPWIRAFDVRPDNPILDALGVRA